MSFNVYDDPYYKNQFKEAFEVGSKFGDRLVDNFLRRKRAAAYIGKLEADRIHQENMEDQAQTNEEGRNQRAQQHSSDSRYATDQSIAARRQIADNRDATTREGHKMYQDSRDSNNYLKAWKGTQSGAPKEPKPPNYEHEYNATGARFAKLGQGNIEPYEYAQKYGGLHRFDWVTDASGNRTAKYHDNGQYATLTSPDEYNMLKPGEKPKNVSVGVLREAINSRNGSLEKMHSQRQQQG